MAVLDIAGEGALAAVGVDGGDALTGLEEGHRDMHGGGGLAGAALLVAEDDDVRGARRTGFDTHGKHSPVPIVLDRGVGFKTPGS